MSLLLINPCGSCRSLSIAALWLALIVLLSACAGVQRAQGGLAIVRQVRFSGVEQVSERTLRQRIATRETPRLFGLVRLPWSEVEYYDPTTFRRDIQRIIRFYQAHGFYSASVHSTRIEPSEPNSREVDIQIGVREGPPTTVGTLWLSGCEPESIHVEDVWRLSPETCQEIRSRMRLHLGGVFTESDFEADRQLVQDIMRERGHASATVGSHATVDPARRRAHVVFLLTPGPPARFGEVRIYESPSNEPARGRHLPGGLPTGPIRSAIGIRPGERYSVSSLANAQRRLFALGVFGIVRIDEDQHRCDSHGRCDAARDRSDPYGYVRVDLDVRLSPSRMQTMRFGGGLEFDQTRTNVHLLASLEWRNVGNQMVRLRIDERPVFFFGSIFGRTNQQGVDSASPFFFGNLLTAEIRRPEIWPGGSFVFSLLSDLGPDPINPNLVRLRHAGRVAAGVIHQSSPELLLSTYLRFARFDYFGNYLDNAALQFDPIFRQQYVTQMYAYLEPQLAWDRRDSPLQTRRGTYASVIAQAAVAPVMGSYTFVRSALDLRGYIQLGNNFVLAARGYAGAALGTSGPFGWPVPQELRFYSGGANSNRGYPFYRAGPVTTIPVMRCDPAPPPNEVCQNLVYDQTFEGGRPDASRLTAVGGLLAWELSVELRWYLGNFGLVAFFDSSDVLGWQPPSGPIPREPGQTRAPDAPGASLFGINYRPDAHPSVGIGLRYVSPIGVLRVDVGVRLDDLNCAAYTEDVLHYNRATPAPWFYVVSRPRCDILGLPIALNLAIGEAY